MATFHHMKIEKTRMEMFSTGMSNEDIKVICKKTKEACKNHSAKIMFYDGENYKKIKNDFYFNEKITCKELEEEIIDYTHALCRWGISTKNGWKISVVVYE